MDINSLITTTLNVSVAVIVLMYLLFAVIIVRQVSLMSSVIITGVDKYVKVFAFLHLAFAFVAALFLINILII